MAKKLFSALICLLTVAVLALSASAADVSQLEKALSDYDTLIAGVVSVTESDQAVALEASELYYSVADGAVEAEQSEIDALAAALSQIVEKLLPCARGEHDYSDAFVTDIEATCVATGSKSRHCSRCMAVTDRTEIPLISHVINNWYVSVKPTCTEAGVESGYCSLCQKTYDRPTGALGHQLGDWVRTKAPSCTERGEEARYCDRCGQAVETRKTNTIAHRIVSIPAVAPTCTKEGSTEGKVCSVCGYVTVEPQPIAATGHYDKTGDGICDSCEKVHVDCSCNCHNDNLMAKIVKFIYYVVGKILRKEYKCCDDMVPFTSIFG